MKNKKGDAIPRVIYALILFAVVMILVLVLGWKYDYWLTNFFGEKICKENIKDHSRLHIGGIEAFSDVNSLR